jgi:hypothetical protein
MSGGVSLKGRRKLVMEIGGKVCGDLPCRQIKQADINREPENAALSKDSQKSPSVNTRTDQRDSRAYKMNRA